VFSKRVMVMRVRFLYLETLRLAPMGLTTEVKAI
jgi:hypothetical protein